MNTQDILLKHVCPGVGCGIALIMFCSPLPAVLRVNKAKHLGDLNALPFAAMAVNCASWVFYALLYKDYYIYFGNLPGMLMGMFYVLTCYKFSKEAAQDMLRNLLLGGVFLFWIMGLVSMAASLSLESTKILWGATCVAVLGVYYVAPLSSVAKVISERDSSSLHWPLCTMNIINGMLWFAYGLALKDWFVCLPNGIGAGFNVICLVMCFVFPSSRRKQQDPHTGNVERVLEGINPASNWGALRIQSFARPPPGAPNTAAAAAGASSGGFFDLTQLRWRTGRALSFRNGSFLQRMLSGSQRSSTAMPPVGSAASGASLVPDSLGKAAVAGLDQQGRAARVSGRGGDVKAGGEDVEQAYVVADTRWIGQQQQQQQSPAVSPSQPQL